MDRNYVEVKEMITVTVTSHPVPEEVYLVECMMFPCNFETLNIYVVVVLRKKDKEVSRFVVQKIGKISVKLGILEIVMVLTITG